MIGRGGLYGPPRAGSTLHDSTFDATSGVMRSIPPPFRDLP
jgi:hypothetical protein